MTRQEKDKAYTHWLYQAVGMGNRRLFRELRQLAPPEEIYEMARRGMLEEKLDKKYKKKAEKLTASALHYDVTGKYEEMTERGISFVTVDEKDYPAKLAAIPDAPCAVYYVGKLPDEKHKSIAVIGARECSEYGRVMAKQFGTMLADAGIQVISGMARGIDGVGQQAALNAGGYSLGVLGCGVDICYPPEHRRLYDRLIEQGGVCSEYPPGIEPRAMLFPPRNRIISGLCDAVLVIEAKERSGTLITVDMALEQGREVYALPGRMTDPLSRGCNRLIRQGAGIVISPQEIVHELAPGFAGKEVYEQQSVFAPESTKGQLMQILDFQPRSIEMLQRVYEDTYDSHITVPELCHELLQLCAAGYAGQISGIYYVRKM
ncbi:MAG: DNA-processing protein DprA [Lachnospiraceae bacterium]|nr:DNA-processing protein DprA [Lachnospiraceae bacterium]